MDFTGTRIDLLSDMYCLEPLRGKEKFSSKRSYFYSPNLPDAFDGYRILQLSDIHSGSWKGNGKALQEAIDICNRQDADLAVFTGDLVNSRADELLEFMPVFSQLKARDGVYSVLGNHDYGSYVKWENEIYGKQDIKSRPFCSTGCRGFMGASHECMGGTGIS